MCALPKTRILVRKDQCFLTIFDQYFLQQSEEFVFQLQTWYNTVGNMKFIQHNDRSCKFGLKSIESYV